MNKEKFFNDIIVCDNSNMYGNVKEKKFYISLFIFA